MSKNLKRISLLWFSNFISAFGTIFSDEETLVLKLDNLFIFKEGFLIMERLILSFLVVSKPFPYFLTDVQSFLVGNVLLLFNLLAVFLDVELIRLRSFFRHDCSIWIFKVLLDHITAFNSIFVCEVAFCLKLFQFFLISLNVLAMEIIIFLLLIFCQRFPLISNLFHYLNHFQARIHRPNVFGLFITK